MPEQQAEVEEAVAHLEDLGRGEVEFVLALPSLVIKAEQTKIGDLHEARHLTEEVEAVEGGLDVVCRGREQPAGGGQRHEVGQLVPPEHVELGFYAEHEAQPEVGGARRGRLEDRTGAVGERLAPSVEEVGVVEGDPWLPGKDTEGVPIRHGDALVLGGVHAPQVPHPAGGVSLRPGEQRAQVVDRHELGLRSPGDIHPGGQGELDALGSEFLPKNPVGVIGCVQRVHGSIAHPAREAAIAVASDSSSTPRSNQRITRPSRSTRMRSHKPRSSGSSDDTIRMAVPSWLRACIRS